MTIAVTGGTGFVGQALLDEAATQGLSLRALARKPQLPREGVAWMAGDLADKAALADFVTGTEAVIHVAGVTTAPDAAGFEAGNVAGTMAMVQACLAVGVPRLVLVSSLSARLPELSQYGASKARAEQVVRASGLDWTIVRPPAVYGPRDDGLFELFRAARWGIVPTPAKGRASLIHAEDLARLLLALVPGREAISHRTFEPDDGRNGGWSHYDLARAIGWAVGKRPWVLDLSPRLMRLAARGDTWLRGAKAKLTLDRVGYMNHPDWVVSDMAQVPSDLWHAQVETRAGLRQTAEWYRAQGWL